MFDYSPCRTAGGLSSGKRGFFEKQAQHRRTSATPLIQQLDDGGEVAGVSGGVARVEASSSGGKARMVGEAELESSGRRADRPWRQPDASSSCSDASSCWYFGGIVTVARMATGIG